MTDTPDQPTPSAAPVAPGPVPTTFQVGASSGPAGSFVVITCLTPVGTSHYFVEPQLIDQLTEMLHQAARQASSPLHLPPPKTVAPSRFPLRPVRLPSPGA